MAPSLRGDVEVGQARLKWPSAAGVLRQCCNDVDRLAAEPVGHTTILWCWPYHRRGVLTIRQDRLLMKVVISQTR